MALAQSRIVLTVSDYAASQVSQDVRRRPRAHSRGGGSGGVGLHAERVEREDIVTAARACRGARRSALVHVRGRLQPAQARRRDRACARDARARRRRSADCSCSSARSTTIRSSARSSASATRSRGAARATTFGGPATCRTTSCATCCRARSRWSCRRNRKGSGCPRSRPRRAAFPSSPRRESPLPQLLDGRRHLRRARRRGGVRRRDAALATDEPHRARSPRARWRAARALSWTSSARRRSTRSTEAAA